MRSRFLRVLGILTAVVLLWVALKGVPWQDTLTVQAPGGAAQVYRGEILGTWFEEEVNFVFSPRGAGAAGSPLAGSPLAGAAEFGGTLLARPAGLQGPSYVDAGQGGARTQGTQRHRLAAEVSWSPGMPRVFGGLQLLGLGLAFGAVLCCVLLIVTRWWLLLGLCACPTSWLTCLRLTFVGLFFNTLLPGSTGGDIARAYVVVRDHPERRAGALMTVMMDRGLGLVAMALIATLAVYTNDDRFAVLRGWVLAAFLAMVLGVLAFVNPTLRSWIRFDALVARLPQGRRLGQLDQSLRALLSHPRGMLAGLLLSAGNHLFATLAILSVGHAFGDAMGFHDYLCVSTVANTLTAVPVSPGGLGVGEVLFGSLFRLAGALYMIGVATSLTYRLVMMSVGLAGGVLLLLPGGDAVRSQFREGRRAARDGSSSD